MPEAKNWRRMYHRATADFPLSVFYFKPLQIRPDHIPYTRHDDIEFLLVHRGNMEMRTTDGQWLLRPGDIALLSPYVLHSFRSTGMDVEELTVKFSPVLIELPSQHFFQKNFLEPLRAGKLQFPSVIHPDHPAYAQVYAVLSALHPDREDTPGYREQLLAAVFTVCAAMAPYCTQQEDPRSSPNGSIDACVRFINQNYTRKLTLEELAQCAGLHPNYLCNRFREVMGLSVFAYIHQIRLENAKRLLSTTELPTAEIAQRCGFNSLSFFRKKFKDACGMTPKQYHKRFFRPNA